MHRIISTFAFFTIAAALSSACSSGDNFKSSGGTGGAGGSGAADGGGVGGTSGTGATAAAGGVGGSAGSTPQTTCSSKSECASGYCVDGYCCDSACDGECSSCGLPGSQGICTPVAEGTDPNADCGDGVCGGTCDGAGACAFPDSSTSCGEANSCSAGVQSGMSCDGAGSCKPASFDCAPYVCGTDECLTSCGSNADCSAENHCDASGTCVLKNDDGGTCKDGTDCQSGECIGAVCCNTKCAAPASCSTGTCSCGNATCGTGEACITVYADTDGDGYGDPLKPQATCANSLPPGGKFVKNHDDCYDGNASAKPGQTDYFVIQRGDGSFDYNCSAGVEKQHPNIYGFTCGPCGAQLGSLCLGCGKTFIPGGQPIYSNGFGCSKNDCSQVGKGNQGFQTNVACGANGTLYSCSTNSCGASVTTSTTQQGCH